MEPDRKPPVVIESDAQGRICLGDLAAEAPARYLATAEPDGTIVLVPRDLEQGLEAALRKNPALIDRIEDNRAHPERLIPRPKDS